MGTANLATHRQPLVSGNDMHREALYNRRDPSCSRYNALVALYETSNTNEEPPLSPFCRVETSARCADSDYTVDDDYLDDLSHCKLVDRMSEYKRRYELTRRLTDFRADADRNKLTGVVAENDAKKDEIVAL
jgi:hypothetical protein